MRAAYFLGQGVGTAKHYAISRGAGYMVVDMRLRSLDIVPQGQLQKGAIDCQFYRFKIGGHTTHGAYGPYVVSSALALHHARYSFISAPREICICAIERNPPDSVKVVGSIILTLLKVSDL